MKLIKGYALISQTELDEALKEAEARGAEKGSKNSKARVAELEKAVEKKNKELELKQEKHSDELAKRDRQMERLQAEVEVLEGDRDDVREVLKTKMENEDLATVLEAKKEKLDEREARVKDLESKLADKEDKNYKSGYADGSADMARKIGEITQQDRDNAMKVAMVTAASHTDPRIVKEVTSAYQLTEGTQDKESPESAEVL